MVWTGYILPFVTAFMVSVGVLWVMTRRSGACLNRQSSRHIHRLGVGRSGGVGVILAFLVALALDQSVVMTLPLWTLVGASILILLVGLWDDMVELGWKTQLVFQGILAAAVFFGGVRFSSFTLPWGTTIFFDKPHLLWVSFLLSVLWIVAVMNAVNWVDGIDGLCGGVTLIGFMTIFFLSLKPEVNQPSVGIVALALVGATIGFLVFNTHPAKILAGTSGAWFFGFMLAALAIFAGTKVATTLLALALPVLDALWVIFDRWRAGASLFSADTRHMHYRLRDLGWSQRRIVFFLVGVTTVIALIALSTGLLGKLLALFCVVVSVFFFLFRLEMTVKKSAL